MQNVLLAHATQDNLTETEVRLIGGTYGVFGDVADVGRLQSAVALHTQGTKVCPEFLPEFYGELRNRYARLTKK